MIGEFVELHRDILGSSGEKATLDARILQLFSRDHATGARALKPYEYVVPGVQIGFEAGAAVTFEAKPKLDFSRSPDQCPSTVLLDFHGSSNWLTLEIDFDWPEIGDAREFQLGLYATANRAVSCRAVVRLPLGGAKYTDHQFVNFNLPAGARAANRHGPLNVENWSEVPRDVAPRLLLFFDTASDLHLQLDYLTVYFS
jgi:hypothetical protein